MVAVMMNVIKISNKLHRASNRKINHSSLGSPFLLNAEKALCAAQSNTPFSSALTPVISVYLGGRDRRIMV
jgi:hypothetical protein